MSVGHTQRADLNSGEFPFAGVSAQACFDPVQVGVSASLNAAPVAVFAVCSSRQAGILQDVPLCLP